MMKVGADIVKISRIAGLTEAERKKLFQPTEIDRPLQSLAGIFAAKEAVKKALGVDIDWLDMEITSNGAPTIKLKNEDGIKDRSLSISHDGDYAIAFVIFQK